MIAIISWNIQNGKGVDGTVSLKRIADTIRNLGTPDIICLQEVSRNLAVVPGGDRPDQVAELAALFNSYQIEFGAAIDAIDDDGVRWQYGNAVLARVPVRALFHHPLPQPANNSVRHMPRQAIELTVQTGDQPLRIVNTHLEYHCAHQRMAQVERLVELQRQAAENARRHPPFVADGPYQCVARPQAAVFCGDFNMVIDSPHYQKMTAAEESNGAALHDAWCIAHPKLPHAPTCGVHDAVQWTQGPHCRDFFFVTADIAKQVQAFTVDTQSDASDHQPLMLTLDWA